MELMATVELVVLQISAAGLSSELVAQDGVERATRVWAKIVAPMGVERPLRMEVIKQRQRAVLGRQKGIEEEVVFLHKRKKVRLTFGPLK